MTHNWLFFSENINKERKTIKRLKNKKNYKHSPFNKEAAPEKKSQKLIIVPLRLFRTLEY